MLEGILVLAQVGANAPWLRTWLLNSPAEPKLICKTKYLQTQMLNVLFEAGIWNVMVTNKMFIYWLSFFCFLETISKPPKEQKLVDFFICPQNTSTCGVAVAGTNKLSKFCPHLIVFPSSTIHKFVNIIRSKDKNREEWYFHNGNGLSNRWSYFATRGSSW